MESISCIEYIEKEVRWKNFVQDIIEDSIRKRKLTYYKRNRPCWGHKLMHQYCTKNKWCEDVKETLLKTRNLNKLLKQLNIKNKTTIKPFVYYIKVD